LSKRRNKIISNFYDGKNNPPNSFLKYNRKANIRFTIKMKYRTKNIPKGLKLINDMLSMPEPIHWAHQKMHLVLITITKLIAQTNLNLNSDIT
jgi:hypothetical protein